MSNRVQHGTIKCITGPMGACKTTMLTLELKRARIAGLNIVSFNHGKGDRFEEEERGRMIVSHDKLSFEAEPIETLVGREIPPDGTVVGIDEAQFIEGVKEWCVTAADAGCHVIVAFLSLDCFKQPWENIGDLPLHAEDTIKLCAVCHYCKSDKAAFTKRLGASTEKVVVGGLDQYRPVCRDCWANPDCNY